MPISVSGSQITFNDSSVQNTSPFTGGFAMRNRIINGAMGIWQRGTSVSGTYVYGADRWATLPFATATMSQSSDVPTAVSQFSLRLQRAAGSTSTTAIGAQQVIESRNCYDLSSQPVTLSFWAKAGANFSSSGIGVQFITGTTADQGGSTYFAWAGQANVISTSISITTTWTKYTLTGTCGANVLEATALFFFVPSGTAGADDSIYITGVQLEKGSTATSFDYRPYGTELQLCQRYFYNRGGNQTNEMANVGSFQAYSTTQAAGNLIFPVQMRAAPTLTVSANSDWNITTAAYVATTCTAISISQVGVMGCQFLATIGSASLTAGYATNMQAANINARLNLSAEL